MNDTQTTVDWEHVREQLPIDRRRQQFKDTALILGNGASVSISPRFDYQQLLDKSGLTAKTVDAIRSNCEVNFEEALRVLAVANKLLDSDADARLTSMYELIATGSSELSRAYIRSSTRCGASCSMPYVYFVGSRP